MELYFSEQGEILVPAAELLDHIGQVKEQLEAIHASLAQIVYEASRAEPEQPQPAPLFRPAPRPQAPPMRPQPMARAPPMRAPPLPPIQQPVPPRRPQPALQALQQEVDRLQTARLPQSEPAEDSEEDEFDEAALKKPYYPDVPEDMGRVRRPQPKESQPPPEDDLFPEDRK